MNKLCMACATACVFMIPAARAAVEYDGASVHLVAGASTSIAPTTGDAGGTFAYPTRPTAPISVAAATNSGSLLAPDPTVAHTEGTVQDDLTAADSGSISLSLFGYEKATFFDQANSGGFASSTYDFTSTTPFLFDMNTTTTHLNGKAPQLALDYLARLGPAGPQYISINVLSGSQSYQSVLLPAGDYELLAEIQDSAPPLLMDSNDVWGIQTALDFSIEPQPITTVVPESASWAMLLGGLGLIGGLARRRRTR